MKKINFKKLKKENPVNISLKNLSSEARKYQPGSEERKNIEARVDNLYRIKKEDKDRRKEIFQIIVKDGAAVMSACVSVIALFIKKK